MARQARGSGQVVAGREEEEGSPKGYLGGGLTRTGVLG